jgi:hypothetical protein
MPSAFETKQQLIWACNLKTCGYLDTHDHFTVSTIAVPILLAPISNAFYIVLESKMYLLVYATIKPMLFANNFINQSGMPFMSF